MDTNLLVGDLIRTKESSVNQNFTDLGKRARGPYFLGRHPALVLQRGIYGYGARDLATITYKQKNGKWSNRNTIICLRYFELVSRPQKSAFLNPFKTWEAYEQRRSITLVKSKKCVYSFQWAKSTSTTDPDTPLMYQPLPMSHAELGAYIRLALSKTSDHESRRENGVMPREYLDEIFQRTTMNFDPVFEEMQSKYKLNRTKLLSSRSQIRVSQLYDCYLIQPTASARESFLFVSIHESDENLGRAALSVIERSITEKQYRTEHSFLSRITPHLEPHILNAAF